MPARSPPRARALSPNVSPTLCVSVPLCSSVCVYPPSPSLALSLFSLRTWCAPRFFMGEEVRGCVIAVVPRVHEAVVDLERFITPLQVTERGNVFAVPLVELRVCVRMCVYVWGGVSL